MTTETKETEGGEPRNYNGLTETVQPSGWQAALPRPEYNAYERIDVPGESWYEVYRVAPGTYALYEPGHFQEVISYLITGTKKALAWDTGMGIAPIRPVLRYLTDLPITALNSHNHFDHVGGNWEFPQVYGYEQKGSRERAAAGYPKEFLAPMMAEDSLSRALPSGFDLSAYALRPWRFAALQDILAELRARAEGNGGVEKSPEAGGPAETSVLLADNHPFVLTDIDSLTELPRLTRPYFLGLSLELGGRRLDLLRAPGHTGDSVMLLDRQQEILFTGDTVYPAALYAHFDDAEYGQSSMDIYAKTMHDIQALSPFLYRLCCSHNFPVNPPELLNKVSDGFSSLKNNDFSGVPDADGNLRKDFDGFSIIFPAKNF